MSDLISEIRAPRRSRSPWQALYRAAHAWRRRRLVPRATSLPVPVWSVGNLHWGGSGKTPIVAHLAEHLRDSGMPIAILSRGYRSSGSGTRLALGGAADPWTCGDEAAMLARRLGDVPVIVDPQRVRGGRWALEHLRPRPEILLLDDGFSHLALARDLDLLTFPASDPFGNGRLAPSGRLREPLDALRSAHAVILTGLRGDDPQAAAALGRACESYGFEGRAFAARLSLQLPAAARRGPVVLVTGVANPARVRAALAGEGIDIVEHLAFGDHHRYPPSSLRRLETSLGANARLLTTEKDAVKLRGRVQTEILVARIDSELPADFWSWVAQRGSTSKSKSPPSTD